MKIVQDFPGVIIDFWSPRCPPCMAFKPKFEQMAKDNAKNDKIIFCAVQTDQNRDISMMYQVSSIPQFNFMLNGQHFQKFIGANEAKFRATLAELEKAVEQKSGGASQQNNIHQSLNFSAFKPATIAPVEMTKVEQLKGLKNFIE